MLERFLNSETSYLEWAKCNAQGFVFNHFGGNQAGFNLLHKCTCPFLWREKDEGRRTVVEKWCSESMDELTALANETRGPNGWKHCGSCFRSLNREEPVQSFREPQSHSPQADLNSTSNALFIPGEAATWLGSGEKEWREKVNAALATGTTTQNVQWIELEFRFTRERIYRKDIDNLRWCCFRGPRGC